MITNCGVGITTDKPLPPRRDHDFYPTDLGTVTRILEKYRLQPSEKRHFRYPRRVLDPGAGSGNWGKIARELWPITNITGCEIRPDAPRPAAYDTWLVGDFVSIYQGMFPAFDLVMGNPPFKPAEEFVRVAWELLHPDGYLIFLLRLSFLEGQGRRDGLFAELPPKAIWVCSKRPSFTEDGKTNATAFAAFVWQKGWSGDTALEWLR